MVGNRVCARDSGIAPLPWSAVDGSAHQRRELHEVCALLPRELAIQLVLVEIVCIIVFKRTLAHRVGSKWRGNAVGGLRRQFNAVTNEDKAGTLRRDDGLQSPDVGGLVVVRLPPIPKPWVVIRAAILATRIVQHDRIARLQDLLEHGHNGFVIRLTILCTVAIRTIVFSALVLSLPDPCGHPAASGAHRRPDHRCSAIK
mmetsp:Transcript_56145/g.154307  ORF Transcript_56145/g.154307 Transcript_56145/m.154307 type:complete len:200 (+) Transcript_56145:716-1315(+)|eukprot:1217202-Prymnesium_polylepis.1